MSKILIVDDNQANRDFLMTLLGYGGHELAQAADGAEALEMAAASRPDLVISDVVMPNMDGYELVRQLRLTPSLADVPVVFYTAHAADDQALAASCGVTKVLPKPSDADVILELTRDMLRPQPAPATNPGPDEAVWDEFDRHHQRLLTNMLAAKVNELQANDAQWAARVALLEEDNARMRLAGARKEELLGEMSREITDALNGIIGCARKLRDGATAASPAAYRRRVTEIVEAAEQLRSRIDANG